MSAAAAAVSPSVPVSLGSKRLMPVVGLGVYRSQPGAETADAVLHALKAGYRHIDTAQFYRNEADVGAAIAASGVPREEIWVTSKVFPNHFGYDATLASVKESVRKLNGHALDLMLLHAPGTDRSLRLESWRALEDCVEQGLVKDIGVSNFGIDHIENLLQSARKPPSVNQIEMHPWFQRRDLVAYCQGKGIVVQAYSPLAKAQTITDPTVVAVAKGAAAAAAAGGKEGGGGGGGVTVAQVLIRWGLQKGVVSLPKSVNPERIESNLDVFGFELSEEEMRALDALECGMSTGWNPVVEHPV